MQLYLFSIAYLRLLWCVHQNESDIYMSKMILIIIFYFYQNVKRYNQQLSDKFWWLNIVFTFFYLDPRYVVKVADILGNF